MLRKIVFLFGEARLFSIRKRRVDQRKRCSQGLGQLAHSMDFAFIEAFSMTPVTTGDETDQTIMQMNRPNERRRKA